MLISLQVPGILTTFAHMKEDCIHIRALLLRYAEGTLTGEEYPPGRPHVRDTEHGHTEETNGTRDGAHARRARMAHAAPQAHGQAGDGRRTGHIPPAARTRTCPPREGPPDGDTPASGHTRTHTEQGTGTPAPKGRAHTQGTPPEGGGSTHTPKTAARPETERPKDGRGPGHTSRKARGTGRHTPGPHPSGERPWTSGGSGAHARKNGTGTRRKCTARAKGPAAHTAHPGGNAPECGTHGKGTGKDAPPIRTHARHGCAGKRTERQDSPGNRPPCTQMSTKRKRLRSVTPPSRTRLHTVTIRTHHAYRHEGKRDRNYRNG